MILFFSNAEEDSCQHIELFIGRQGYGTRERASDQLPLRRRGLPTGAQGLKSRG